MLGADYKGNGICEFLVWAPLAEHCVLKIVSGSEQTLFLEKSQKGYFRIKINNAYPGLKYFYEIEKKQYPDPASYYQPEGVHGPSAVIDHNSFNWMYNNYEVTELKDLIIYELHIGTFSHKGTFKGAIEYLEHLKELGITAVEIMPVSQFPGNRNWGYDGVHPFAPQNTYGSPDEMKHFIDQCHRLNLLVILDVVYNHLGPEGNYIRNFGPYFTSNYKTPWGDAINYDGEYSDEVRNYFFENALFWLNKYNIDGLRLDAIDHIYDMGAKHFLTELSEIVEKNNLNGRKKIIIAESDLNDTKIIRPLSEYGYGCNAQWSDDFHHSVHTLLTGESDGYYLDFGKVSNLVSAYKHSFVYSGKFSQYRKRTHGNSAAGRPVHQFVVSLQNHDQVGNRAFGKRLTKLISFEALKLAAGTLLLSPYIPLLFMGEEYGEDNPFLYFISHEDPDLVKSVREGRSNEFRAFNWGRKLPDPFSADTFERSKLKWELRNEGKHKILLDFYKRLISCRKENPAFRSVERHCIEASGDEESKLVLLQRCNLPDKFLIIFNFNKEAVTKLISVPEGNWRKVIDSASEEWMGSGMSTPDTLIDEEQNITIKGLSFSAYEAEVA